jgi:conjugal transfer pilus assembly protein TraW
MWLSRGAQMEENNKNERDFEKKINIIYWIYVIFVVIFIMAMMFLLVGRLGAKDFGLYGKNHMIAEPDIQSDIRRKLEIYERGGKLKEFEDNYKKVVIKQIKEPNRVVGIANASKDSTRKLDPITEIEEDIMIPKGLSQVMDARDYQAQLNGKEVEYEVLYKAGTMVNPLKYMRFNEPLIFIDGNNEEQLEFARNRHDENPLSRIILIDGKPGLREVDGREYYYYFDQWGAYSERFNISNVPSVVWQKEGEEVLTIDEIKLEKGKVE